MIKRIKTLLAFFTLLFILILLFTDYSFTGFWSDVIILFLLATVTLIVVYKTETKRLLKYFVLSYSALIFLFFLLFIVNPLTWSNFEMTTFHHEIDGRSFNSYFRKGILPRGEGVFWITESQKYFPFIENQKYFQGRSDWDFSVDVWDGQIVNQNETVKSCIRTEIINKGS